MKKYLDRMNEEMSGYQFPLKSEISKHVLYKIFVKNELDKTEQQDRSKEENNYLEIKKELQKVKITDQW